MSARAVLAAKVNSMPFEDRVLVLDVPAKIGRSHKEDQADSGNSFFDCKVLSRAHAMLLFEDEKFFLMDTGSSNGSFVNNIRLSKASEESKLTRIYTNDVLRFGSDVVDKSRQVTQKCVVCKVRLFMPDGSEVVSRPSESRLFRPPSDITATDDLHALTQSLQEALSREKIMEDKLVRVRTMISRNIGRSHTDMLRAFENIKEELMAEVPGQNSEGQENAALEKTAEENMSLLQRISDLELSLRQSETMRENLSHKQQEDSVELATLRKACQIQKEDIAQFERNVNDLKDQMHRDRIHADEKLAHRVREGDEARKTLEEECAAELRKQEDAFMDERAKIRAELHEVTANEVNLLNRIKCLESEEGYAHAEMEKVLQRERDMEENQQQLQYKVETLEVELRRANEVIEEQKSKVKVERMPEDIARIEELEATSKKLQEEMSYYKQELIDARARKSASDDELGTVRGKLETLENNISSLGNESAGLRKQISELQSALDERTQEAKHLNELVIRMEQQPSQDEALKVQIADLKSELATSEATVKDRNEEIAGLRRSLRERDETIQQREIDISCLRGQVQNMEEEGEMLKNAANNAMSIQSQAETLAAKLQESERQLETLIPENQRLEVELQKQQTLYSELRKMRGRGEELDALKESQQEVAELRAKLEEQTQQIEVINQLQAKQVSMSAGEAAQSSIGSLKVYEVAVGLLFVVVFLNAFLSFVSIF